MCTYPSHPSRKINLDVIVIISCECTVKITLDCYYIM